MFFQCFFKMVEKHWTNILFDETHWQKHWKHMQTTCKKHAKHSELLFWFEADPIEFSDFRWNLSDLRWNSQIYGGILRFTVEFSDLRWNSQIYVEFLNILLIWYVSLCCSIVFNVFVALCFNVCWWLNGFRCLFFFSIRNVYNVFQYCSICFNVVLWFNVFCWL